MKEKTILSDGSFPNHRCPNVLPNKTIYRFLKNVQFADNGKIQDNFNSNYRQLTIYLN